MFKSVMTPIGRGRMTNPRGAFPLVSLLTSSSLRYTTTLPNGAAVDTRNSTNNWSQGYRIINSDSRLHQNVSRLTLNEVNAGSGPA